MNRVGEVWEFDDGLVFVVLSTSPANVDGEFYHDVLILKEGTDYNEDMTAGTTNDGWMEHYDRSWEREELHDDRWRVW